ncbi:MAG TPA: hypothetical protein PK329_06375 [Myxococcota bacterium]|nr:hypothetical protein [Myxococcota bacterium]HOS61608.1 hypothetical protein [Myxococcota bacterium]HPC91516.1 hypothetical protein [Myxococcota bacterium]HPL24787.1 hypothetical protein [Myxococcota bacterium]HRV17268.1 hypothetical protein [Myxococcota bacterium]
MQDKLKRGLVPVLVLVGALIALGCGGGNDDAVFGNGEIEGDEQCDGAELNGQTCITRGFTGGELACTATCQFDTSGCTAPTADCGNGKIDDGEQCDGEALNGQTCVDQGFAGGDLACTAACQFDTSGCTAPSADCGNGKIDDGEQCDGEALNGHYCTDLGFAGGDLGCTAACQFDTSGCILEPVDCGNGKIDDGEQCDGEALNGYSCADYGFAGGDLGCTADCRFDTSGCTLEPVDCGNGEIDDGEQCDGEALNGQTCANHGFAGGDLGCTAACQFDTSGCTVSLVDCGNGEIDDGEQCDGEEFDGKTCATQGFDGGDLGCTSTCQFDTSACFVCGDGKVGGNERCDGDDLNNQTCTSQGFDGGQLRCTIDCQFDTSACVVCGDGRVGAGEECDSANLNGHDCVSQGFDGGRLACTADCEFDTSNCSTCGDGVIGIGEQCDGVELNGQTCVSQGFVDGKLGCTDTCQFDTTACSEIPPECGNGRVDGFEQCDGEDLNGETCETLDLIEGDLRCTDDCRYDTSRCAFDCTAVSLGMFDGTPITLTNQDSCSGTTLYDAKGTGRTCTGWETAGSEIVYSVSIPPGEGIFVVMDAIDSFNEALWVTMSCRDTIGLHCIVGSDVQVREPEEVSVRNTSNKALTYHIVADASDGCGKFNLSISRLGDCGDGVREGPEQCDGRDFGVHTCESIGFAPGTLRCNSDCEFDFSRCGCKAIDLGVFDGTTIALQDQGGCPGSKLYDVGGDGGSCLDALVRTPGAEVLYKLTLPAGDTVKIVSTSHGFDETLWVTTSCLDIGGSQCVVGAAKWNQRPEEAILSNNTGNAATYYIVVDAKQPSGCGKFDLNISRHP